LKSSLYSA